MAETNIIEKLNQELPKGALEAVHRLRKLSLCSVALLVAISGAASVEVFRHQRQEATPFGCNFPCC
jgi:hypothetical protein